jgi:hypothetical protein
MGYDARKSEDQTPARAAPSAADVPMLATDASAAIGYEAADPSLFTPDWSEALEEVGKIRSLR